MLIAILIPFTFWISSCKKSVLYTQNDSSIDSLVINISNSFSPSINGINDFYLLNYRFGAYKKDSPYIFVKAINNPLKKFEMEIRDGENKQVFYTTNIDEGWNGYYNNVPAAIGSYNVYFHLEGKIQGIKNEQVQLLLVR